MLDKFVDIVLSIALIFVAVTFMWLMAAVGKAAFYDLFMSCG